MSAISAKAIISECDRVIALADKATKGPWKSRKEYFDRDEPAKFAKYEVFPCIDGLSVPEDGIGDWTGLAECGSYEPNNKRNADHIADARTSSPALARALKIAVDYIEDGFPIDTRESVLARIHKELQT